MTLDIERARKIPIESIAPKGLKKIGINTIKGLFNCRSCGAKGDVIDLAQFLWDCDFSAAVKRLTNGHDPTGGEPKRVSVAYFDYTDEDGKLLFQVVRQQFKKPDGSWVLKDGKPDKTFRQRRPHPDNPDEWIWNLDGVRQVPYKLPKLIEALSLCDEIFIVEGERKVDLLLSWGFRATCNAMGAKNWHQDHAEYLRDSDAIILPDSDKAGVEFCEKVGASLVGVARAVRVLHLPDLPLKGDIVDWAKAGGTKEKLRDLVDAKTEPWISNPDIKEEPSPGFSDDYLALAFTEKHSGNLRFISRLSRWMNFDGKYWREDDTLSTFDMARKLCRDLSPKAGQKAKEVASARTVAAVERFAKADRRIAATINQWDADPWLLNTPDGVVDLKTGEMRPHRPEDYMTRITSVAPGGDCPLWLKFIDRVTDGDQELASFLQRMIGYALTGVTTEHAMFFLYGTGGNGKSVFLSTIDRIISGYHRVAPIETFTASSIERHPTDLAGLMGARLVTAVETQEGRKWDETKIKTLTGGDKISARFMRQDFFEYVPQFKLIIAGNHKPGLRSVDEAIRRRFYLVPFTVTIQKEERDTSLPEKLKSELPGILAWIIKGCLAWQSIGLAPPAIVQEATATYLEAEDAIGAWITERYERDPDGWATSAALFENWKSWATQAGETVGTQTQFTKRLEGRKGLNGPTKYRGERGYWGLRMKT